MDLLKAQLDRIQQQLGGLSASQKMLSASLVAIMVMTLVWWGKYAGEAELTPVLDASLSQNDVGNIERHLRAANIPTKVASDRVLVPTDRRDEALAVLSIADALPMQSADAFDDLVKKINPFTPQSQTDAMMRKAKESLLAGVIRKFPGVRDVTVLITPSTGRRIGGGSEATASVNIYTRDGSTLDSKCVNGAAMLIARAESGLQPSNVSVMVNLRPQTIRDPNNRDGTSSSAEYAEMQAAEEARVEDRLSTAFPYISGIIVRCSVEVDNVASQTQQRVYDAEKTVQKEIHTESTNQETSSGQQSAGEPGVLANVGVQANPVLGGGGGLSTTSNEKTDFTVFPSEKVETSNKPAGATKVVRAAIQLPRSYFVGIAKQRAGASSTAEPTEEAIIAIAEPKFEDIRKSVVATCNLQDPQSAIVTMYDDVTPMLAAAVTTTAALSVVTATLTGHVKEIAVGLLAVVSLAMLMMMVRKGNASPIVIPSPEIQMPQSLSSMGAIAGIVGDGESMLDGIELDDDSVKAQQMLAQVQTMVKENPDGAATLVKRWMNRT